MGGFNNMTVRTSVILAAVLFSPGLLPAQSARKKVLEGNRLYLEEKYDEANNKYQDALLEDPGSTDIQFNIGNVLYKKNNPEKAIESYQKSLSADDPMVQAQTYYNIGNSLYRAEKLPESILAYEQALKLNPDDQDAKYNLEYVRNKLKENAQPQEQNQEDQQQQQEQNKEEQEQKEKNEQDKQNEQKEQEQQQASGEEKKEMSKEEAERLLEALKEDQKDMKKKEVKARGRARVEKDW